jgi:hypothetical protein
MKLRSEQPSVSDGFEGLAYFQELVHFFFRYAQVSRRVRVLHPRHYQDSAEFSKIGQFFFLAFQCAVLTPQTLLCE